MAIPLIKPSLSKSTFCYLNDRDDAYAYAYDDNGNISSITRGTTSVSYEYNGANELVQAVDFNGTYYYYLRNGQGDIVKLIDGSKNTVVEYTYDSWGKQLSCAGTLATTLGALNPFRYRGYVYDEETGFYYLKSRYYDPETCRFISADVYLSTGQGVIGHNCYIYCLNNPTNRIDVYGTFGIKDIIDFFSNLTKGGGGGSGGHLFGSPYKSDPKNEWQDGTHPHKVPDPTESICHNPWGCHGGPQHREVIETIKNSLSDLGWEVPEKESRVYYLGEAYGKYRYPDIKATYNNTITIYIQVGRSTKSGLPISRENRAMEDLQNKSTTYFIPYDRYDKFDR